MKEIKNIQIEPTPDNQNLELACGPCWGHQQYEQGYRPHKIEYWRGKKDNFISRFVKKYIR